MGIITKQVRLVGSRGEHTTNGLFDSGASYSFIRKDIAERLATLEPLPQPMPFEMAQQGVTVTVYERVVLDFWIDGYRFSDEFLVLDNLSEELIIGAKTMQAWRLKIDMEREDIIIDPSVTRLRFI
ncbi:MAG: retropepsin-like domain-containing protein [Armatimonadetes bacterium]|nr:retropepsin-like domain-containing protein [Armatimonadota bacterium]MCX7967374.1 retropepsin-like domain-containing protein [Armatimonadota bacterium]MDW8142358.1 retropepsin-like aspartic protease [Armatimonadota bacterium]